MVRPGTRNGGKRKSTAAVPLPSPFGEQALVTTLPAVPPPSPFGEQALVTTLPAELHVVTQDSALLSPCEQASKSEAPYSRGGDTTSIAYSQEDKVDIVNGFTHGIEVLKSNGKVYKGKNGDYC